jgi:hypothetical protein
MVDRRPVHDRAILDAVEAIDPERFAGEVWRVTRAWTVPAPCISYYAIISSRAVAKRGRGHSMPDVNLPLSGPVTQTFPWTNYITINVGTSSNPAIEKDALSDVASYGKQLGRIGDALIVFSGIFQTRTSCRMTRRKQSPT